MKEKLSAAQINAVLGETSSTLRKLASERDTLAAENHSLRKQLFQFQLNERVEKIAHEVHAKGIEQGRTPEETREFLLQKAASGELDVVEQAIGLTAAQAPLGYLGDKPTGDSSLEEFVLS